MKQLLLLLFCFSLFTLQAQDYLSVPSSNPLLFQEAAMKHFEKNQLNREKAYGEDIRDSIIYSFDTLDLPFLDDFSRKHFYKNI